MRDGPAALLVDYGGVLTRPLADSHRRWSASEDVDEAALDRLLYQWRTEPPAGGNPVHLVETGAITPDEFECLLVGGLRDRAGRPLSASGLLARMFAWFRPEPAMIDLVRRVRERGFRTALVTNSWGSGRPWDLLPGTFDDVVVSYEVGARKPDARIYLTAADRVGAPLERCVFVDDLLSNVTAATGLGMLGVHHVNIETTLAIVGPAFSLDRSAATPDATGWNT